MANQPVRTVAPASDPLSLERAKEYARIEIADESALQIFLLSETVRFCEDWLGQALITQTWRWRPDSFYEPELYCEAEDVLRLPRPPLQSISSITYVDSAGASQTWSASLYQVDTDSMPGRLRPAYGESWPTVRDQFNAVTITFVAGYGAATSVPEHVRLAMHYLFNHWERQRELIISSGAIPKEIPQTVEALLSLAWHGSLL